MIGWKVMRYDPSRRRIVSGADSRQKFPLRKGMTVKMPGAGIWLSNSRKYVVDHYAGHDWNILLKFEFDPDAVVKGNLTDREAEFSVPSAKLMDFWIADEDDVDSLYEHNLIESIDLLLTSAPIMEAESWEDRAAKRMKYYEFTPGMTIQDVLDRWVEGDKLRSPSTIRFKSLGKTNKISAHGLISVAELMKFKEYSRPLNQDLVDSIEEVGFNTVIHVIVGKDGAAKVGEGNHRIVAAAKLGIKKLPVEFHHYRTGK